MFQNNRKPIAIFLFISSYYICMMPKSFATQAKADPIGYHAPMPGELHSKKSPFRSINFSKLAVFGLIGLNQVNQIIMFEKNTRFLNNLEMKFENLEAKTRGFNVTQTRANTKIGAESPILDKMEAAAKREPVSEKSIGVVLRTWSEDAVSAVVAASSAVDNIADLHELIIVTDEQSKKDVEDKLYHPLLEKYGQEKLKFIVEDSFLVNGHIQQKYSKMMADTYTDARYILHIDSDCAITNWEDDCFLRDDKPINEFDTWENLPRQLIQWREGSQKILATKVDFEFSRINQHVYPRELYKMMRDKLEEIHEMSFKEIFKQYKLVGTGNHLRQKLGDYLISDFNLLGGASYYYFPETMFQLNLGEPGAAWRKICTTQCNSRRWSDKCCEVFRLEQIAAGQSGQPVSNHLECENYDSDHPCACETEKGKKRKKNPTKKNHTVSQNTKQEFYTPCTTQTNTTGFKCLADGYCYGSVTEDTCEKIVEWFDRQENRKLYPDCKCPE